ncbi:MAG: hypothetical protein ACK5M3_12380 [Dysgonomonas sp.]
MGKDAHKVVMNTGILYGKMLLTIGISLYTTRIVLNALGATDFGIYNLVAGVIAMLSFLNVAMTVSTQRYLSYYQGSKNLTKQSSVFYNSFILHLCIGLLIVAIVEVLGIFLFDLFFNIPVDRVASAKVIYHFMALSIFFTIISVPFIASVNAHENMYWVAIVDVLEVLLKLGVAIFLGYQIINYDNLIFYGLSTAVISFISMMCYSIFCLLKYKECSLRAKNTLSRSLLRELTSFAGWNLFGSLCGIGRIQGIAVLLNFFFGAIVNAAYGIANQVASQMSFFSVTMLRALNPQIMKSEGAGDRQQMLRLSMIGSKFGFFLLAIVAIPCIFEMSSILTLWLKDVPEYTIVFCKLILIGAMVSQLTIGLQSAIQATGKIKIYQSIVGVVLLLSLPIAYVLLRLGFSAYSVFFAYIGVEVVACFLRLIILKKLASLNIKEYVTKVFAAILLPVIGSVVICCFMVGYVEYSSFRFLLTALLSTFVFSICIFTFGLDTSEKGYMKSILHKIYNKLRKSKV